MRFVRAAAAAEAAERAADARRIAGGALRAAEAAERAATAPLPLEGY